jgi:UDP-N-acetylglucosamine--N-acetylmuramyl-(pentapeptide) pyrophosphoryl-undecaprenol N-acetylglucosamine transferase
MTSYDIIFQLKELSMRICIVTGGTGGHIYPALALVEAFKADDSKHQYLFIGNADRMESTLIPQAGYRFEAIQTKGLQGSFKDKLIAIWTMVASIPKSYRILSEFKPNWVIGFGGYVCVPVMFSAKIQHISTALHEQNAVVGKANRLLSYFADVIIASYASTQTSFPNHKSYVFGNPRTFLFETQTDKTQLFNSLKLDPHLPTVLWVMGSLGSESVNTHLGALFELLSRTKIQFICVSGPKHYEDVIQQHDETNQIKIVPYLDQVAWMQNVDLMITRGGATTAAEIMMSGIPSIIIPSPYVPNNHQFHNAKQLFDAGAAVLIEEKELNARMLFEKIQELLSDAQLLKTMRQAAQGLAKPKAAQNMIQLIKDKSQ